MSGIFETWNIIPRIKMAFAWEDERGVECHSFSSHAFKNGELPTAQPTWDEGRTVGAEGGGSPVVQ